MRCPSSPIAHCLQLRLHVDNTLKRTYIGTTIKRSIGNGNMLSNKNTVNTSKNKTFTYNLLNLPQQVTVATGTSTFIYDATGNKLRKITALGTAKDTLDYISGIQYKNRNIDFIQTEEGKIAFNKTTGVFDYEYYLGDNLGNTRVTFNIQNGVATALQRDDYMPFGYEISNGSPANPKNEYLYNKKELQEELGQYDYGARFYDPLLGRWNTPDPKAEKFQGLSPYSYVADNPILLNDPNGMDWTITMDTDAKGVKHYHFVFTGAVVNLSSNKKIDGNAFAKALTDQFNKLFNKSDSKDGYTIDGHAEIEYFGRDRSNVLELQTALEIVDSDDPDLLDKTNPGRMVSGMEVKYNANYVEEMMPDKNGKTVNNKTGVHEIGHTAGLLHPDQDKIWGIFPGSTHYMKPIMFDDNNGHVYPKFPYPIFMNQGGSNSNQWSSPTGPSSEQAERMLNLYNNNKLNRLDSPLDY